MQLGERPHDHDVALADQVQRGGGLGVVGEVDVGLVNDDQPGLRVGRETRDLGVADGGAGRIVGIADERQLGLDTGHGVEVMGPLQQRDAGDLAAQRAGDEVVDLVRRVGADGSAAHRRERDHQQVHQLIGAVAHQDAVRIHTQLSRQGRPHVVGQRVGVTVDPAGRRHHRGPHRRRGAERRLIRRQAAVLRYRRASRHVRVQRRDPRPGGDGHAAAPGAPRRCEVRFAAARTCCATVSVGSSAELR